MRKLELPKIVRLFVVGLILLSGCKVDSTGYRYEPLVPVSDGQRSSGNPPQAVIPAGQQNQDVAETSDMVEEVLDAAETGLDRPTLPFFSGGQCPKLQAGLNNFSAGSIIRQMNLFIPPDVDQAPMLFLWHDKGESLATFSASVGAQSVSEQRGAVVVVIGGKIALTPWDFSDESALNTEEQLFFDVLACVAAQVSVDSRRIYSMGFGAGAAWAARLLEGASGFLAAVALFNPEGDSYEEATRKIPVFLSWGGQGVSFDTFGNAHNFSESGQALLSELVEDGHPVLACSYVNPSSIPNEVAQNAVDFLMGIQWAEPPPTFDPGAEAPAGCALY